MTEEIYIEIPGKPVPWSVKVGKRGNHGALVAPMRLRIWQKFAQIKAQLAMVTRKPIEGPVHLSLEFVFPIPINWSKKKREDAINGVVFHTVRPDSTNLLKALEDSLTAAGVWMDDSQVCIQETKKIYGKIPMVSVIVKPIYPIRLIEEVAG